MELVEAGSIKLDEQAPQIVDAGSITLDRRSGELSLIQGRDPSMLDRVFDMFSDPVKEKARAVNAIVDSEALNIRPALAYDHKSAIDKYYNINPENKKRKEKVYQDIKRFNDMGGVEDEWQKVIWNNAKSVPYQMQIAAGGIMKFLEENPVVMDMMPTEETLQIFKLAVEAREKKTVRTLGDEIAASGAKKVKELQPTVMPGSFKDTAGMATQSALNNLIYLAPGMWAGRAVPLIGMGAQAFGQSYIEQREGGSGKGTATAASLAKAASEVLTEFIPVGIYLKPRASFVRSLAAAEMAEIPTEVVNQIVNDVVDKVTIRPDMTPEEAIDNIMTTIQVTALSTPGISGATYSVHKAIGMMAARDNKLAGTFNGAKNSALMAGETPQAALRAGIEAVKGTPEGAAIIEQKLNEIKKEAQSFKPEKADQPFIFGVNEDANGDVTSFTMADPVTGETFEVAALKSEEKEKMTVTPDMEAVNAKIKDIREIDQTEATLDKLIQGDEDIEQATNNLFRDQADDVPDFQDEAKPETIIDRVKAINDRIGEKGSIDIAPLVDLGRSIWAEGHQTIEAFTSRAKELLSGVWDKVKGFIQQAWEKIKEERGSFSTKKIDDPGEINLMLSAAARQDQGAAFTPQEQQRFESVQQEASQQALDTVLKKAGLESKKLAASDRKLGENEARQLPVFQAVVQIIKDGGISRKSLEADYDKDTIKELARKRPGLVSPKSKVGIDDYADQFSFESGDNLLNAILDWQGLKKEGAVLSDDFKKYFSDKIGNDQLSSFYEDYLNEYEKNLDSLLKEYAPKPAKGIKGVIRKNTGQVKTGRVVREYEALTEAFRKEAQVARVAFREGKKGEIEQSKEKMRWLMRRRESLKNVRDYFTLTDSEFMDATNRRNPALMDDGEFKQFLLNVEQKAVELAETRQAKVELMMLIESKRLQKVDNYRQAMELPTIDKMTTQQLREFAKLLEPFEDDDIFLTQRELETVDRTDLKGIKTIREAKERLAKEAGVDVEELNKVHVAALDQFRWDSSLRDRDPFFDIMVTRMTEASLGAELRTHDIESKAYELARKADKSRELGIVGRLIPQDDLIMAFLEAPVDRKAAVVEQMTPEQIDYANFMQQYFAEALNYLIATKSLERGRENYFVHIRKTFLENLKDGGLKKAITELFSTYQQDQMVFNILDDDTGNILPLEKFFQFSLQRTDTMDPTRNVTKAFLTYMRTFEKKKMYDAIIPKLDIYAQALTPVKYTPRGLEIDRSLKTFVNKWINNKKGRRLSFDSTIRQGGPLDVGIRALRTFTTILDLGLSPIAQIASLLGEQVTNATMLGTPGMALGTSRMVTGKGKRIIEKYRAFVGRSLWEELAAPGKEVTERLSQTLFAGFHISTVLANKQFLLASMSEQEFAAEEITPERLAEMRLDMGRFRVVPGTGSLVGSTSVGDAVMQYKKWAVPFARTLITDGETLISNLKEGKPLDDRAKKELIRFAYLTGAVFIMGALAGADDKDDKSFIGKSKARLYREAMSLTQGMNPLLFIGVPRTWTWLLDTTKALKSMVLLEEYKTKDELKGPQELKRQFVPGAVRSVVNKED